MNEFCLTVGRVKIDCTIEVELSEKIKDYIDQSICIVLGNFEELRSEIIEYKGEIELSLLISDDTYMQSINKEHRGKDSTTDVLSFPLQESVIRNDYDSFKPLGLALGDMVISHPVCEKQAKESSFEYGFEFSHLFAHGLLHLIGLDHERSSSEEKRMFDLEDKLVEQD